MSNSTELLKLMFAIYLENLAADLAFIQLQITETDVPLSTDELFDLTQRIIERVSIDANKIRAGIQNS